MSSLHVLRVTSALGCLALASVLQEAAASARRAIDLANIQYRDGIADFERVLLAQEAQGLISTESKDAMRERTNWGDLLLVKETRPVAEDERGKWRAPDR